MKIKGAKASAKPGAMAHEKGWQRWSHGQFAGLSMTAPGQSRQGRAGA